MASGLARGIAFRVPSAARNEVDTSKRLILRSVTVGLACSRDARKGAKTLLCVGRLRQAEERGSVQQRDEEVNTDQRWLSDVCFLNRRSARSSWQSPAESPICGGCSAPLSVRAAMPSPSLRDAQI